MQPTSCTRSTIDFYPRPPRGGRHTICHDTCPQYQFLSTPSARRATTVPSSETTSVEDFYPRPPRGGRLARRRAGSRGFAISIHALREEGDTKQGGRNTASVTFLSTPSARRATLYHCACHSPQSYFYPRPPRGGRRSVSGPAKRAKNFYPRPPRGGRPTAGDTVQGCKLFLSTPSARRAT